MINFLLVKKLLAVIVNTFKMINIIYIIVQESTSVQQNDYPRARQYGEGQGEEQYTLVSCNTLILCDSYFE